MARTLKVNGIARTKLASLVDLLDQIGTKDPTNDQKQLAGRRIQILSGMLGKNFLDLVDLTHTQRVALHAVTTA